MNTYYNNSIYNFLHQDKEKILGELVKNDTFDTSFLQKEAWQGQINILKDVLSNINGDIIFEYTVPRMGRRIDNVLLIDGIIFLLEFKVGTEEYNYDAEVQVRNYALDLLYFHKESHNKKIIPILIATEACNKEFHFKPFKNNVYDVIYSNGENLKEIIQNAISLIGKQEKIDLHTWINSEYRPTPTIIEAAQELYKHHSVKEISQNESAENLTKTASAIQEIINYSKINHKKSICFITGVPGAGKTLAGLNISISNQNANGTDYACFLSGNYPLVKVLQKSLSNNAKDKDYEVESDKAVEDFIQIVHLFRDVALNDITRKPTENIVVFDEAQRAWNNYKLAEFLKEKKTKVLNNIPQEKRNMFLKMSEAELFIEYMDRRDDWSVIVCLVGGGQDINDGEAGIEEWFNSIKRSFNNWDVYISDKITDKEYIGENTLANTLKGMNYHIVPDLHLSVSLRSFRCENVSKFVHALIDNDKILAQNLYKDIKKVYPICITRDLNLAKNWVKKQSSNNNTNSRYGIIASSKAKRLRAEGIWVECKCKPEKWFLSDNDDIKSSYYMEEVATEFDVQGLEIDWAVVGWGADYRYENGKFSYYNPRGSRWNQIHSDIEKRYLKNAYRVLLTRAREGFIIFVPKGDDKDSTRLCKYYDELWNYLVEIGITVVDNNQDSETKNNTINSQIETIKSRQIEQISKKQIYIKKQPIKEKKTGNLLKIGATVQTKLTDLFQHNLISDIEINNLKNLNYCKQVFNLDFPLLIDKQEPGLDKNGYNRYWKKIIFDSKYRACSEWYEYQREYFMNWYYKIKNKN